jgi:thiamine biosynthesis lipoprotein
MKKLILLILSLLLLSSCGGGEKKIESEKFAFGTLIKVTVYDSDEKKAKKSNRGCFYGN